MFKSFLTSAVAGLVLSAAPALADWSTSVVSLGISAPGQTGEVECPAGGSPGTIWGTGTYTSDSSICGAAQHFGWLAPGSGATVSFRTVPGLDAYQGSAQNGITTNDYPSWSLSFQVTGAVPLGGGAGPQGIDWSTTLDGAGVGEDAGATHTYLCPPGGATNATIWGADVYTSDSPICISAVHRGLITTAQGGPVTVLVLGSQPAYSGTSRNGVTSSEFPSWGRSYVFVQ